MTVVKGWTRNINMTLLTEGGSGSALSSINMTLLTEGGAARDRVL
jgi:hypothetical protein